MAVLLPGRKLQRFIILPLLNKRHTFLQKHFNISSVFSLIMALCEMCGKEARLVTADIEGGELNVCSNCTKYGTVKKSFRGNLSSSPSRERSSSVRRHFAVKEEPSFRIVDNYSSLIRSAREKRDMSQEDFAKSLNERESLIAKWEQGSLKPRINIARKLEKKLGVKLVVKEETDGEDLKSEKSKKVSDEFTLGDFIKVRKRK